MTPIGLEQCCLVRMAVGCVPDDLRVNLEIMLARAIRVVLCLREPAQNGDEGNASAYRDDPGNSVTGPRTEMSHRRGMDGDGDAITHHRPPLFACAGPPGMDWQISASPAPPRHSPRPGLQNRA